MVGVVLVKLRVGVYLGRSGSVWERWCRARFSSVRRGAW
ncbi:MAG: hypothetical protein ACJAYX_004332, partial [Planctomycetota bacterium]